MPLNQSIFSPLTNYSGSISAFTSNAYTVLQVISSSLPIYQATGWDYVIMTNPSSSIATGQTAVTDLTLNLDANTKYIVEGYLSGATAASANGLRVGVSVSAGVETHYVIENPTSTTAIGYAFSITNAAGSGPGNNVNDYYLIYIKALVITRGGTPTWVPTISSENAGGGATEVRLGPSIIYYRAY